MGSTREVILEALENLTHDELKKFKLLLLSVPLREGYGRLPRGPLLSMDAVDLTDKLVNFYLEAYAAELTTVALRNMGMQEAAQQLLSRKAGSGAVSACSPPVQAGTAPHFVDKHRSALIARVADVNGVLDALYQHNVLGEEQYQAVRAQPTSQERMRKLFSFAPSWNRTCKDLLLQALKDTQPFLVADLESS
ncbi:apoptosis-associated speck-like protein containing a CARD [Saccopteryx leptura]|uniref:apoptosis-associated speck-like protein containing a CARD n=1 Tax=Saccopteryx leptura TaxID=249018 RepID=UPI00339BCC22